MSMNNRKIAGFMSAESIYSLAFYIVMVAAIAGVGAGVMSKTGSAKAVSAVSLIRANYQAEISVAGYGAVPTSDQMVGLSGGLLTADAVATNPATLTGVGGFLITNRPTAGPTAFSIDVSGISSPDVCKSVASVGWGTWDGVVRGTLTASAVIPSAAATASADGLISTRTLVHTVCNAAGAGTAAVDLTFVSK